MINDTLTAIEGLKVGHAVVDGAPTGCTVVLPEEGVPAGVDIRGGAPGTYGTDTLRPVNLVERVHGLFFTGGSAFGLDVAQGVRSFLKERDAGFESGYGRIPIVAGAVVFDLGVNRTERYPDASAGYRACEAASALPVEEGSAWAGVGATLGKFHGLARAMKSGIGSYCVEAAGGLRVGALMVVNPFGDVVDPGNGALLAGCRQDARSLGLSSAEEEVRRLGGVGGGFPEGQNTVVGVVAVNARLDKTRLTKVAQMAHAGLARTICPAHTLFDGDAIFAIASGDLKGVEVNVAGILAAQATAEAVLRAVRKAESLGDLPAWRDLRTGR